MNPLVLFAIFTLLFGKLPSETKDLSSYFKGYEGCFVLYNLTDDSYIKFNEEKCSKRVSPCSTFKIPNSLIALETGVLKDENTLYKWDGKERSYPDWNRDHTLASAIKFSVVWYYQQAASLVGEKRMQEYLKRIDYGNKDMSSGLTGFWLNKSLLISPNEQVQFLTKLYRNELPFDRKNTETVKKIIVQKKQGDFIFSGKTGTAMEDGKTTLGWFVGYIRKDGKEYVFAVNIEGKDGASGVKAREISVEVLKSLGLFE